MPASAPCSAKPVASEPSLDLQGAHSRCRAGSTSAPFRAMLHCLSPRPTGFQSSARSVTARVSTCPTHSLRVVPTWVDDAMVVVQHRNLVWRDMIVEARHTSRSVGHRWHGGMVSWQSAGTWNEGCAMGASLVVAHVGFTGGAYLWGLFQIETGQHRQHACCLPWLHGLG